MPKQVDHEQRRRELGAAVWDVIGHRGLDGASIREVAAAAGWSNGSLRHYFRTRDELLRFAFGMVGERTAQRFAEAEDEPPREAIRRILLAALPIDEDSSLESVIWWVFSVQATVYPELQEEWRRVHQISVRGIAGLLGRAQEAGELAPDLDPEREAILLLASLDGIGYYNLSDPSADADAAVAMLDLCLARLFDDQRPPARRRRRSAGRPGSKRPRGSSAPPAR